MLPDQSLRDCCPYSDQAMAQAVRNETPDESIQAAHIHEVHEVPMHVITRPFQSELNEPKVQSLMETIQVRHS